MLKVTSRTSDWSSLLIISTRRPEGPKISLRREMSLIKTERFWIKLLASFQSFIKRLESHVINISQNASNLFRIQNIRKVIQIVRTMRKERGCSCYCYSCCRKGWWISPCPIVFCQSCLHCGWNCWNIVLLCSIFRCCVLHCCLCHDYCCCCNDNCSNSNKH